MTPHERTFPSGDGQCAAWIWEVGAGRPWLIMAHGLGGIRRSLQEPARRLAEAGFSILLFDYRNNGDSPGEPRQLLSIPRQLQDWSSALAFARQTLEASRVGLWGTSFSGGHVVTTAAAHPEVSAVVAQCPMLDGRAAFLQAARRTGWLEFLGAIWLGCRDWQKGLMGQPPFLIPVAGSEGSLAFLNAADSLNGFWATTPPDTINGMSARAVLTTPHYRPITRVGQVKCPVLLQICEKDSVAPVSAARKAAELLGKQARVQTYPIGHFDIYLGDWLERALTDQIDFLREVL